MVSATVLVLAAGARRTDSAHDRFLTSSRAYDLALVTYCSPVNPGLNPESLIGCQDEVARLPAVADASPISGIGAFVATRDGRSLQPDAADPCYGGPGSVDVGADLSGRFGTAINRSRIVAGRRADRSAANEVVISQETASRLGLGPGSELQIRLFAGHECFDDPKYWRRPVLVKVVGVQLSPGEVPPPSGDYLQTVEVTPAFVRAQAAVADRTDYVVVRLRAGATSEMLREQARRAGYTAEVVASRVDNAQAVDRAIRPTTVSLAVLAAMTALAGMIVVGQVLMRRASIESVDGSTLAALGMGRGRQFTLGMLRAGTVGIVAACVAVTIAIAASSFMPIGLARRVEPDRGFAFDPLVFGLGAALTVMFVAVASAVPVWRAATASPVRVGDRRARRATVANIVARAGFPPTAVSGTRLALERGAGRTAVPVVSSFVGLTIAVTAVVGALTFGAGLSHLQSSPRLFGWNWDLVLGYPSLPSADGPVVSLPEARARATGTLESHPGVTDYAMGTFWTPFPQGRPLRVGPHQTDVPGFVAFDGASRVGPSVIAGRKPAAANEILFGPETLRDLGLQIGDEVEVFGQDGTGDNPGKDTTARMRVVGTGVIPIGERFGRGAAMTLDGLARLTTETDEGVYFVRVAPGTDPKTVLAAFQHAFPEAPADSFDSFGLDTGAVDTTVDPALNLDQIDAVPGIFAVIMGLMAAAVLAHVLVTTTRARRRDLAVLRTLGFTRAQTMRTVAYEATIWALVAVLIGAPIGIALGRVAWRAYAAGLGVVPEATTPWIALALTITGTIAIALIIALQPAWTAAHRRAATTLRSE
jgi:ABC-type antimicrobial peptide transport system permease subunit